MLKLAIEAQLPLIAVTTRDTLNLPEIVNRITGKQPVLWAQGPAALKASSLYLHVCSKTNVLPYESLYTKLVKAEASLIVVNPSKPHELLFHAGEVPVPKGMMLEFLDAVVEDQKKAQELLPALGGCTIKEAAELARLTMARDHGLTARGLMMTRKTAFQGSRGLTQVDTNQTYYDPPGSLYSWVKRERDFFLGSNDPRLIPRGLLMDGPPGTGKTEAAKYIAAQLGVPLYRVDIAGAKSKWVGESEQNVASALSQLNNEQPCVALFDEIEKIFAVGHGDSGVTTGILSQLLWWLAERRSRVLAVMTTNDVKKLPRELYREGRVDEVMWFGGLEIDSAKEFAKRVLATFPGMSELVSDDLLSFAVSEAMQASKIKTNPATVSQAAVTKTVYSLVKSVSK